MKKILFTKFSKDVFKFFLLISLSLSIIIWIVQAVNFLDYISEDGHGIKTYFLITILNLPKTFSRIVPFCIFIASFYVINKYESKNELLIFWNIGITKIKFINNLIILSTFFLILQILLNTIIVPNSQNLAREFIRTSNIDFFPNLVKEKKFIDVVSNLTIYVESKDREGNYLNVFLKDKLNDDQSQVIYAKRGKIVNINNINYLILNNGKFIDIDKNKITTFEFKKTEFDLSKYVTKSTTFPKVQEIPSSHLFKCFKNLKEIENFKSTSQYLICDKSVEVAIKEEIFKRFIKPFFIPVIILITCIMILYNKDYFNYNKIQYIVFTFGFFTIIISEILTRWVESNDAFLIFLLTPLIIFIINYLFIIQKLRFKI